MNKKIEYILAKPDDSISDVMRLIDVAPRKGGPSGISLIVDDNNKLLGVVTDGDIRRAILKGVLIEKPVSDIMTRNPITVKKGKSSHQMINEVIENVKKSGRLKAKKVEKIIIVDEKNKVYDVISFFELWRKSEIKSKEICIVGLGFVGLTLALSLADVGLKIVGVDKNLTVVKGLKKGIPHFHEVGLESLLKFHVNKSFIVQDEIPDSSDVYIICVDTPIENRKPNMNNFKKACSAVGKVLSREDLVIVRSTVPVGTCMDVARPIIEKESGLKCGEDFYLAMAPERTLAGKAIEELKRLPQIIGGINSESIELTSNLFKKLTPTTINVGSLQAAEMVKLIDNSWRDLLFAYSNELALLSDRLNLDTTEIIKAANDGYTRNNIPLPSPGVGGSCLTKDPLILLEVSKKVGYEVKLPRISREINEYMPIYIKNKIIDFATEYGKKRNKLKIFIIGFAFKGEPETSDIRKSSTLDLLNYLKEENFTNLFGYDPVVSIGEIEKTGVKPTNLSEGFESADVIVIMNNHKSYADMNIYELLEKMSKPGMFFDGWHIFSKDVISKIPGIKYDGLGGFR